MRREGGHGPSAELNLRVAGERHPLPARGKRFVFTLLTFGLSVGLIAALVEVTLHVLVATRTAAEPDSPLRRSSFPGLGYELIPDHVAGRVRTGPFGLRPRPDDGRNASRRILFLGDSIVYGMGVPYERSVAPVLEALLARSNPRVAVWNAGVPGYNTAQEVARLKQLGPVVQPDTVVLQYCLNDYLEPARLAPDGILEVSSPGSGGGVSFAGLLQSSRLLTLVKEQARNYQQLYPQWFPVWTHYVHRIPDKPGWQRSKSELMELDRASRSLGARLLVVLFPMEQQLRLGERRAQDDLLAFGAENHIRMLDLYSSFQAHWRDGLYVDYWGNLGTVDKLHPNERGQRLAATEIARALSNHPSPPNPAGGTVP